jgi:hypothetical protein
MEGEGMMYECQRFDHCRFFMQLLPTMPRTSKLVQSLYCKSNYSQCARYRVGKTLGANSVPDTLSPGDGQLADLIIQAAG